MLFLQLLGSVSLASDTGPVSGPTAQRRRLALLARMAAAPHGSVSRDKLIACFWPDEDRERGRHFLADSVFTLRKNLGKDVILSVGDDLILNHEAVECDLWQFHAALEGGDPERAVALYAGPFLDGFFVADAPEVERWVEEERARLGHLYAAALERLAEEMERRSEHARAVHWWRRLAAQDPCSSRVALRLMQALSAAGDRAAAIQHAKVHAALLDGELGLSPDPQVQALAVRLSAMQDAPPIAIAEPAAVSSVSSSPVPPPQPALPAREWTEAISLAPSHEPAPPLAKQRLRHRQRLRVILLPMVGAALFASVAMIWSSGLLSGRDSAAAEMRPTEVTTIAVMPFTFQGTPEWAHLREGLVTLLSTSLNGAGTLRSVDHNVVLSQAAGFQESERVSPADAGEIAIRLEADLFTLGTVVETAGKFRITVTLYRPGTRPAEVRSATLEGTDPFALVDDLSRQLLVGQLISPADRLSRLAVLTTPSLPALKAYLQGDREFRAARYPAAVAALRLAVQEDPSFALAHYRLSTAEAWSFHFVEARHAADDALGLAEHLTSRDQGLISAWHALLHGDWESAEHRYNAILADYPSDVEAWSGLGEVQAHYNPLHGDTADESVHAFQQVLRLAPNYGEARFHLLEFAARSGDSTAFNSLLSGVDPESPQLLSWQAARELSWGKDPPADSITRSLLEAEDVIVGVAAVRTAIHFRELEAAQSLARLLTRPGRPAAWQAAGHIMLAQGYLARGDWDSAGVELDASEEVEPGWALEIRALGALLPDSPVEAEELRQLREKLERWNPREADPEVTFFFATHADVHTQLRFYLLALLSLRLDDDEGARRYSGEIESTGPGHPGGSIGNSLRLSIDAHRARRDGELELALRLLEAGSLRAPLERIALSPFFAQALDRYLRAEVLTTLGRPEEALRWYASLSDGADLLFWAAARQRQSELLAQR